MIPQRNLLQWSQKAPWPLLSQIEQDLILSRILVELYQNTLLSQNIVFRGGTALNKIYASQMLRYSEDLDFVQVNPGPIGPILETLKSILMPWLGEAKWKQSEGTLKMFYFFQPTDKSSEKMRIKIEINTREHFHLEPLTEKLLDIQNPWFQGQANIMAYSLEESLGTKLRALYQRKKGRDLFDIYMFMKDGNIDVQKVVALFQTYMSKENTKISKAEFERNLALKMRESAFCNDMNNLIRNPEAYDMSKAYKYVMDWVISLLPGDSWKGLKKI